MPRPSFRRNPDGFALRSSSGAAPCPFRADRSPAVPGTLRRLAWTLSCLCAALVAWVPAARALDPRLKITQFAHDAWEPKDGLPSSAIQAVIQSPDGYLWLGTSAGLVRFDGVAFTLVDTYPADPHRKEYISALAVTPNGTVWIGTRYTGLRRMTPDGRIEVPDYPLIDPQIRALAIDARGRVLVATAAGLDRIGTDGVPVRLGVPELSIHTVATDSTGRVWVGYTDEKGVYAVEPDDSVSRVADKLTVNAIMEDRTGIVWIGTDNGLCRWTGGHLTGTGAEPGVGAVDERVVRIYEDRDGALWAGTLGGVRRIDRAAATLSHENLRIGEILALCEDREGSLWIGTGDGLHRLKSVKAIAWGKAEGIISDRTQGVAAGPDGSVYVLTGSPTGVTRLKAGQATQFRDVTDGPTYVAPDSAAWICSTGVISRIQNGQVTQFGQADGLLPVWISAMGRDADGLLVSYSSMVGLRRWDGHRHSYYRLRDGSDFTAPFHLVALYSAPDGTVWAAGYDGLWHLDHGEVTRYTTAEGLESMKGWYAEHPQSATCVHTIVAPGLVDHNLTAIADDGHGTLWIASQRGGLTRLRDGKFQPFTTKQGLATNQIYSVLVDGSGDLWMGSPIGIMHVTAGDLAAVAAGRASSVRCELLTRDDGMRNEECSLNYQPAAARAADGTLWFATKNAVVSIDPTNLHRNTVVPAVHLDRFLVDGIDQRHANRHVIGPGHEKFEFRYDATSLLVPSRVLYRYRLDGYDRAWSDAGPARVTQYTRLPPGEYTFRVMACNNDGVWNEAGAAYTFTVRPHYYETIWFYGLCAVALVLTGVGLHHWRIAGLKRREAELQARVVERTAELSRANSDLQHEIVQREKAQQEVERIHRELMLASHQAGMAEVATGVLHNVGNVLNSLNVSAEMAEQTLRRSKLRNLQRVIELLLEHRADLGQFVTEDPKGRQIPEYLRQACELALADEATLGREVGELRSNVEHIRQIVAMQQEYARLGGVAEPAKPADIMEDALRINATGLARHNVGVVHEYDEGLPPITVEKHKVLQILVNFIQNAKYACDASERADKLIRLKVAAHPDGVCLAVQDNGIGIREDQLAQLFTYGYTTRKDGHGFGLHSGALAAREMGGSVRVRSDGPGRGAVFELILPVTPPSQTTDRGT